MAVALRARTPLAWQPASNPVWPAGTVAGDVVLVWNANPQGGPYQPGWKYLFADTWWKRLSSADLAAGPGQWAGDMIGLVTVTGCRGAGKVTTQRGVTISDAGGAILVEGWTSYYSSASGLGSSGDATRLDCIRAWKSQWCAWWLRPYATTGYKEVERDSNAMGYRAIELLPFAAPAAPTLAGPSGDVDATLPTVLEWTHNSASELPQETYRVRVKPSASGTWQYLTAAGALSATEQTVASAQQQQTILAGTLSAQAWDWSVSTSDGDMWSAWSASLTLTPVTPPNISSVTLVQGAAGEPWWTIGWPTIATPTGIQTAYEVAVAPAGAGVSGAVWSSRIAYSAVRSTSTPPSAAWPTGQQYQAWVRIQQTGGIWSQWTASSAVTMTYTTPAQPTTVTPTDGTPLTVTVAGVTVGADRLEVQASTDGIDWYPAAMYDTPNPTQSVDLPLAAFGTPMWYRARTWKQSTTSIGAAVLLPSAWRVAAAAVASTDRGAYIVATDGEYLPLNIVTTGAITVAQGVATSYGLDAELPRTDRTPTAGRAGTVTVWADTVAEREALIAWLTERPLWWVRWSPELHPDTGQWADEPPTLMALADAVSLARWTDVHQTREITWTWVQARED